MLLSAAPSGCAFRSASTRPTNSLNRRICAGSYFGGSWGPVLVHLKGCFAKINSVQWRRDASMLTEMSLVRVVVAVFLVPKTAWAKHGDVRLWREDG